MPTDIYCMSPDSDLIGDLIAENLHSNKKYDAWDDKTFQNMARILSDELLELNLAIIRNDLKGDHGIYVEAIQVANCAMKMARQAKIRGAK